ncbi:MAG: Gfo/Idh/MocA family oxidoreductase [Bacteroidota bacterium]
MENLITRRNFNTTLAKGLGGAALLSSMPLACSSADGKKKKLGVALVGLGEYSTYLLAPALQETGFCKLAAIVTGTPEKEKIWADKYNIKKANIYNYENFDKISENEDIDIVYVVLPNSMHAEFSIRAAQAGKHVICEKPMATSVKECRDIIQACNKNGVKLSVGYRLHSEPYTKQLKKYVRESTFGKTLLVSSGAAYLTGDNWDQWRFNKALSGGGALMNMGVYAIQGAIYSVGKNPVSVTAQEFSTIPEKFRDTDETVMAQFEFPGGAVGNVYTSHNAYADRIFASCSEGWVELSKAFTYGPLEGRTSAGKIEYPHKIQQALQMDDFSLHIQDGAQNVAPGEMGLRDLQIIEGIYKSIETGSKVELDLIEV